MCNQETGSVSPSTDVLVETRKWMYCIRCQRISSYQDRHGPWVYGMPHLKGKIDSEESIIQRYCKSVQQQILKSVGYVFSGKVS